MKRQRILRRGLITTVLISGVGVAVLSYMRTEARTSQKAFVVWARRAAIPLPASTEEPLSNKALSVLNHMLDGKRFVFLGEPDHYLIEKFPYRLVLIRSLFEQRFNSGSDLSKSLRMQHLGQ